MTDNITENQVTKKKIGRPRKHPIPEIPKEPKPRGRQREKKYKFFIKNIKTNEWELVDQLSLIEIHEKYFKDPNNNNDYSYDTVRNLSINRSGRTFKNFYKIEKV